MDNLQLKQISEIREILHNSNHAVFFGGAGVSTDSGIPDFRSAGGLYSTQSNEYYLSKSCLENEPEKFFEFYRRNMIFPEAQPNTTHKVLAELEKKGIIKAVITQNIDGLHQAAGSRYVIELHGTVSRCFCSNCRRSFDGDVITESEGVPVCEFCSGIIRPEVTLYEEALDGYSMLDAQNHVNSADVLIVGGTSLRVYPAAGFVEEFSGKHLIIVNMTPTPFDDKAEYVIRASLSEVFEKLL